MGRGQLVHPRAAPVLPRRWPSPTAHPMLQTPSRTNGLLLLLFSQGFF